LFKLAHASDWHATSLEGAQPSELLNKRLLGWLSWKKRRRNTHRPEILRALFDDMKREAPDQIAVTGDLTNVSLESEFEAAASLLSDLGSPDWVSIVPGNHDAYVPVPRARGWRLWSHYMASDDARRTDDPFEEDGKAPVPIDFPTVRIRGPIALVGLCTALPTLPGLASGRVGQAQLSILRGKLANLRARGLCRVVLMHHPVRDDGYSRRRRLLDSAAVREVLRETGAELVLHGHGHRRQVAHIAGPDGAIPAIGVRSSSHVAAPEKHRSQYHIYSIDRRPDAGFRISLETRGYDASTGLFASEGEVEL
jgi:3',5'-cyclic AMP phosphodiesterase CpdA